MKPAVIKYLICMKCSSHFDVEVFCEQPVDLSSEEKHMVLQSGRNITEYETEILTGRVVCHKCALSYPISDGIPRIYKGSEKDFPLIGKLQTSTENLSPNPGDTVVQKSFSREWAEFDYDDETVWLWSIDGRIATFCEELGIASAEDIRGKLMIDAGCGSGVLSMELSRRYLVEIIAIDISFIVGRAFGRNKSNLCHFVQTSLLTPPFAEGTAEITYSHGALHHTHDTKMAFQSVAKLTRVGGLLYVFLYGKKKGWNRFRFFFFHAIRAFISRLPRYPQDAMIYVMALTHLAVRFVKRCLHMETVQYKSRSQFLVNIRDHYTPLYAREHSEDEVRSWFCETGYANVSRRADFSTCTWMNSTDLSMKGIRS